MWLDLSLEFTLWRKLDHNQHRQELVTRHYRSLGRRVGRSSRASSLCFQVWKDERGESEASQPLEVLMTSTKMLDAKELGLGRCHDLWWGVCWADLGTSSERFTKLNHTTP